MLSQTVDYALRAVVVLARTPRQHLTAAQIAADTRVPLDYLSKILGVLVRAGIVAAQRGRGGGFLLPRPPAEMTALQVVSAVEPVRRIRGCPLALPEHNNQLCPLHRTMDDAFEMVERALASTTIASLVAQPEGASPLCQAQRRSCVAVSC